jgi:hypothetical protein
MSAPYDPDDILTGRRVFFSRTELIAWINERRQGGE